LTIAVVLLDELPNTVLTDALKTGEKERHITTMESAVAITLGTM
jgi:hypothetical protein